MKYLIAATLCLLALATASGAPLTWLVTVDTSSIAGVPGYSIDLQLNPGDDSGQPLAAAIASFNLGAGSLSGAAEPLGAVAGVLPGTVTIANSTPLNSYFHAFTPGSGLSFTLTLSGAALDSPNGVATAGSTFAVLVYDSEFQPALTIEPNGILGQIDVGLDGFASVSTFDASADLGPAISFRLLETPPPPPGEVPEPATLSLVAASLCFVWLRRGCRLR